MAARHHLSEIVEAQAEAVAPMFGARQVALLFERRNETCNVAFWEIELLRDLGDAEGRLARCEQPQDLEGAGSSRRAGTLGGRHYFFKISLCGTTPLPSAPVFGCVDDGEAE